MGRIQSIYSFSTVDGPGARTVVFFQGCPVGCIFCHNPDSWNFFGGEEISVTDLMRRVDRFRPFLPSPPGLTLSGGEPLAQVEFAVEIGKKARAEGWHVALDTSGYGSRMDFARVVKEVDLVMFSIKHPLHQERITGIKLEPVLENLRFLAGLTVPVWLRYVLINGWTDQPEALKALGNLAAELPNLQKIEILPFNGLAENKWADLGWEFRFTQDQKPVVTEEDIKEAEGIVYAQMKAYRASAACMAIRS